MDGKLSHCLRCSFPPDSDLDSYVNSTEFKCLLEAQLDLEAGTPFDGCPIDFDRILCWPKTESGAWAVLPCFKEYNGVIYDHSQNATRYCHPNGKWDNYSHYTACHHMTDPPPDIVEITSIIYYSGYIISLIALSLAVIVFVYFKDLRCLRNTIHANLFITYILSALMWMVILTQQLSGSSGGGLTSCVIFVTLLHYFTLTNFFWMLVEGLYLYMLVVETFSGDNLRFNMYAAIGYGLYLYMLVVETFSGDNLRFNMYAAIGYATLKYFVK
ncbi:diuretic hormone receptor [Culex quinquefasciatus]|uniref:Diuretic hormone receptor n=1 Tax=Culex quinquefasciatus TaxID=7176 RepID=B0WPS6_CULQU|nr:diuretic hormone receptor [Culex quinquefasciatus]|eukprot:XP_001850710.1 diuretic hormone receptor [Culex quinquefasciatus]